MSSFDFYLQAHEEIQRLGTQPSDKELEAIAALMAELDPDALCLIKAALNRKVGCRQNLQEVSPCKRCL